MNKLVLLITAFIGFVFAANAQEQVKKEEKVSGEKMRVVQVQPQFKTSSTPASSVNTTNQTLLQELYLIEDDRHRIEKDQSLSQTERSQKIQENNTSYISKKMEFMTYVASKGVLNISKQEQNYYLYLLKYDKKEQEYIENINLIKNSK